MALRFFFHRRKIHPKKSTQNKKVHLNKFFWTIRVGFLTRLTGSREKFARTFRKSSRKRGVFFWYFGILGGFGGLYFLKLFLTFKVILKNQKMLRG